MDAVLVSHDVLTAFARGVLEAAGVPPEKALLVSSTLVEANLRGVDSHGVQLLPFYVDQIGYGNVVPLSDGRVISENGACLVYDGEMGLGQVISEICCGHSIRLAKEHGLAMVVARESNHFGAAAHWAQKMSDQGMLGIVMCNASPIVPTWQGREGRLGTNPLCVSVPGDRLWLLDMATTTVAMGKILRAHLTGQDEIPAGWAMNKDGLPTTNTTEAMAGFPMPLGGYKGSGLAMMVEVLSAVLGGGAMSTELGGIRFQGKPMRVSQTFLAIDVTRFIPIEEFDQRMRWLRDTIKGAPTAPGYDEVLMAGEPEWRNIDQRKTDGIPVARENWESLVRVAERLNVPVPAID